MVRVTNHLWKLQFPPRGANKAFEDFDKIVWILNVSHHGPDCPHLSVSISLLDKKIAVSRYVALYLPGGHKYEATYYFRYNHMLYFRQIIDTSKLNIPEYIEQSRRLPGQVPFKQKHVTYTINIIFKESEEIINLIPAPPSRLILDFGTLLERSDYFDVIIRCNDNIELKAHKAILTARCPVFQGMFRNNTKESKSCEINISEFSSYTIGKLLKYIYTDKVELEVIKVELEANKVDAHDHWMQLYQAADKYQLDKIKSICEHELLKSLSVETAVRTIILSERHDSRELFREAINFFKANTDEIRKTLDYELLMEDDGFFDIANEMYKPGRMVTLDESQNLFMFERDY